MLLLPYPVSNLVVDVVLLLLYLGIEATRIFFGESPPNSRGSTGSAESWDIPKVHPWMSRLDGAWSHLG